MGTIRESGYREYPDHLTPGKGGESSLLFDKDGGLSGHAPFYADEADDESEPGSSETLDRAVKVLALVGLGAVVFGLVEGSKRALARIRTRRSNTTTTIGSGAELDEEDVTAATATVVESDEDEALIEEVKSLCEDVGSKTGGADGGRGYADEEPAPDAEESDAETATRRRLR